VSNPSAIAEARRLVTDAEENLAARRALYNSLLPELPATVLADLEGDEQARCPHVEDGVQCPGYLVANAATSERSPVLGWGPRDWHTEKPGVVLWLSDYDYGDWTDPIDEISCLQGHAYRVPEEFERNV